MWMELVALFILGDTKAGLIRAQENLSIASDKSKAKVELAQAYWQDQNQEKAYKVFLEAILTSQPKADTDNPDEEPVYQKALALYLNQPPEEAKTTAEALRREFGPALKAHPEWSRLRLLYALAEANTQDTEAFFEDFYAAYPYTSSHFLTYKTLAILHIKLFERAKEDADREGERCEIRKWIAKAQTAYPADFSLYRMEIAYAPPSEKDKVKEEVLNKILRLSIIPPRRDILYFLRLAKECGTSELFDQWLKKAMEWVPGSRSIQQLGAIDGD
jgi:hypothetical protein